MGIRAAVASDAGGVAAAAVGVAAVGIAVGVGVGGVVDAVWEQLVEECGAELLLGEAAVQVDKQGRVCGGHVGSQPCAEGLAAVAGSWEGNARQPM